ncbi:MAG: DNA helicase RecQ [Spirochaetales bacterium]|nr:DNA helicase RecQ [Spirochaetales bacterium]
MKTTTAARSTLKKTFGFSSFRPHQKDIIEAILEGQDVFAVLPTGGGKSLCYQLPSLLLEGLSIVISPLLALMKDQVDAAVDTGIPAACLNSSLTPAEASAVYRRLEAGEIKLLYISPERFALPHFAEQLKAYGVKRFAVDEAHCLSEWGHDFRPDYLNLGTIRSSFPDTAIAAFTATATLKVQKDIVKLLRLQDPFTVRASFDRAELRYRIIPKEDATGQILRFISERPGESGIIYRTSRANTEKTAAFLVHHGVRALPYHAGLARQNRMENQDLFNRDEADVIVATIAFGMGIDKSNVRFIIHADMPKSIEGYYQETGRAGRDGLPAECLFLYSSGDISRVRYFIDQIKKKGERARAEKNLQSIVTLASTNMCRRKQILEYFDEEPPDTCGNCDVCLGEIKTADASEDARKLLSAVARTGERFGAGHVIDVVRGADTEKIRKFRHQHLPTWGVGSNQSKIWWRGIVDDLVAQKCLIRDSERFNSLSISDKGKEVLYGRAPFEAALRDEKKSSSLLKAKATDVPGSSELFQKLRAQRKMLARSKGVPPYVIFSDKTLKEMASLRPDSLPAMLRVTGVGEHKLDSYGADFLHVILKHLGYEDTSGS